MLKKLIIVLLSITLSLTAANAIAKTTNIKSYNQSGLASWYGRQFHGRLTANGERFNMHDMTAAHKTLPLGCTVRVTNKSNGRSIIVKVNDRGPYIGNRILDLSYAASKALGFTDKGVANVHIEVLETPNGKK